jgi:hypothetical protein
MTTDDDFAIHTTTQDGVGVIWGDVDGDPFGALVVGAGGRDLEPTTAGLHHLVEHVVMGRVGSVTIEHNAESSLDTICFWAAGDRAAVLDYLRRVAAALASLETVTDEEVARHRQVVQREVGLSRQYAGVGPFSARWGAAGLGLADIDHAPLAALTAADVRAFAQRWLVADRVRVVTTFEPPDDLALGLPRRDEPGHAAHPVEVEGDLPALVFSPPGSSVTLGLLVGGPDGAPEHVGTRQLAGAVVEEALTRRLRGELGEVYSVGIGSWWVREGTSTWVVTLDPHPSHAASTLVVACRTLRALAAEGPDAELVEHARGALLANLRSNGARGGELLFVAESSLRGIPVPDRASVLRLIEEATADGVRDLVGRVLPTLLTTLPADAPIDDATAAVLDRELGLVERRTLPLMTGTRGEIMRELFTGGDPSVGLVRGFLFNIGSAHKGRSRGPRRGAELRLGPRHVVVPALGVRIRIEDIVLAGQDADGDVELVTRSGGAIVINPTHYRRTDVPWARFVSNVPPSVIRHKVGVGVG